MIDEHSTTKLSHMCGRFSFTISKERIEQQLGPIEIGSNLRKNYNIAPTQHAYVIANDNPQRLQYITWGLIPYWSRDGENGGKLINARKEGISAKPSFRLPIRNKRCLVLADSFYEWRKESGKKVPYRISSKDGKFLLMAGIWDTWTKGNYTVKSFSVITTPPNLEMERIHNRMPIIFFDREQQEKWLGELSLSDALSMLKTPPDDVLRIYRVSDKVNSVKNNSEDLHRQVPDPLTLF